MATPLAYLDPKRITGLKRTVMPRNPYPSGYGKRIPSSVMIQLDGKPLWRRVYVMCWSNSGTAWVTNKHAQPIIASGVLEDAEQRFTKETSP